MEVHSGENVKSTGIDQPRSFDNNEGACSSEPDNAKDKSFSEVENKTEPEKCDQQDNAPANVPSEDELWLVEYLKLVEESQNELDRADMNFIWKEENNSSEDPPFVPTDMYALWPEEQNEAINTPIMEPPSMDAQWMEEYNRLVDEAQDALERADINFVWRETNDQSEVPEFVPTDMNELWSEEEEEKEQSDGSWLSCHFNEYPEEVDLYVPNEEEFMMSQFALSGIGNELADEYERMNNMVSCNGMQDESNEFAFVHSSDDSDDSETDQIAVGDNSREDEECEDEEEFVPDIDFWYQYHHEFDDADHDEENLMAQPHVLNPLPQN